MRQQLERSGVGLLRPSEGLDALERLGSLVACEGVRQLEVSLVPSAVVFHDSLLRSLGFDVELSASLSNSVVSDMLSYRSARNDFEKGSAVLPEEQLIGVVDLESALLSVSDIVQEVFGSFVPLDTSLFEAGMDSLSGMLLLTKLQDKFGVVIASSKIQELQTGKAIAEFLFNLSTGQNIDNDLNSTVALYGVVKPHLSSVPRLRLFWCPPTAIFDAWSIVDWFGDIPDDVEVICINRVPTSEQTFSSYIMYAVENFKEYLDGVPFVLTGRSLGGNVAHALEAQIEYTYGAKAELLVLSACSIPEHFLHAKYSYPYNVGPDNITFTEYNEFMEGFLNVPKEKLLPDKDHVLQALLKLDFTYAHTYYIPETKVKTPILCLAASSDEAFPDKRQNFEWFKYTTGQYHYRILEGQGHVELNDKQSAKLIFEVLSLDLSDFRPEGNEYELVSKSGQASPISRRISGKMLIPKDASFVSLMVWQKDRLIPSLDDCTDISKTKEKFLVGCNNYFVLHEKSKKVTDSIYELCGEEAESSYVFFFPDKDGMLGMYVLSASAWTHFQWTTSKIGGRGEDVSSLAGAWDLTSPVVGHEDVCGTLVLNGNGTYSLQIRNLQPVIPEILQEDFFFMSAFKQLSQNVVLVGKIARNTKDNTYSMHVESAPFLPCKRSCLPKVDLNIHEANLCITFSCCGRKFVLQK